MSSFQSAIVKWGRIFHLAHVGPSFPLCTSLCVLPSVTVRLSAPLNFVFSLRQLYSLCLSITQGQRDGEVEEEKREKPKATFEAEKLKELTEGEADVIGDVINPNGLPVQNGLDVDVKEFG